MLDPDSSRGEGQACHQPQGPASQPALRPQPPDTPHPRQSPLEPQGGALPFPQRPEAVLEVGSAPSIVPVWNRRPGCPGTPISERRSCQREVTLRGQCGDAEVFTDIKVFLQRLDLPGNLPRRMPDEPLQKPQGAEGLAPRCGTWGGSWGLGRTPCSWSPLLLCGLGLTVHMKGVGHGRGLLIPFPTQSLAGLSLASGTGDPAGMSPSPHLPQPICSPWHARAGGEGRLAWARGC